MKITKVIPFLLALIGYGISYPADYCSEALSCPLRSFVWEIYPSILNPIWWYSVVLLIPFFFLIFVSKNTFSAWLRLATWIVPISLILIFVAPVHGGWFPDPLTRNNIATWTGGLFALITLAIIVRGQFFNKR